MTKLALALLLPALLACSSGPGGSSTGGTSGGTSSGGSTTGGTSGYDGGALCSTDLQCVSGQCLGGRCCQSHCLTTDAVCGATACLANGDCVSPGTTVGCGGGTCDTSTNSFEPLRHCNGAGSCDSAPPQACGGFTCLANIGCPTLCIDDTVCPTGTHCFPVQKVCCTPIAPGSVLEVDSLAGSDTGCCGAGPRAAACQTLTVAMEEIERSHATGVTIHATMNGDGGSWSGAETWPVVLHSGVTVHAPGIAFFIPDSSKFVADVFDVRPPSGTTETLPVTLRGDTGNYLHIGFDLDAGQTMNSYDGLLVRGLTVSLSSVWLGGAVNGAQVEDSATLEIDGPVRVGGYESPSHVGVVPGGVGILCEGSPTAGEARVTDTGAADGDLIIQAEANADLYSLHDCTVVLDHAPVFGVAAFDGGCPAPKPDTIGLLTDENPVSVTLRNPTIQCMRVDGVQIVTGTPVVTLDSPTVTHCGCTGLRAFAGTIYSSNGTIAWNHRGVVQQGGLVFLNGGGTGGGGGGGGNTIGCSNQSEPGACAGDGTPGVDVENDGPDPLNADNSLLDHLPASALSCTDRSFTTASCTCVSLPTTICSTSGSGFDGVDLVTTSTGTISTADAGTNTLGCN